MCSPTIQPLSSICELSEKTARSFLLSVGSRPENLLWVFEFWTVPSPDSETTRLLSGDKVTEVIKSVCPSDESEMPHLCIPHSSCIVIRARDDALAVRREPDRDDDIGMSTERLSLAVTMCLCIPYPDRLISRSRDDALAVGRKHDGPDYSSVPSVLMSASHTLIVSSKEPETIHLPSGENATDLIALACPSKFEWD